MIRVEECKLLRERQLAAHLIAVEDYTRARLPPRRPSRPTTSGTSRCMSHSKTPSFRVSASFARAASRPACR